MYLNKKGLLGLGAIVLIILIVGLTIYSYRPSKQEVESPVVIPIQIDHSSEPLSKVINFTIPSKTYTLNYQETWEIEHISTSPSFPDGASEYVSLIKRKGEYEKIEITTFPYKGRSEDFFSNAGIFIRTTIEKNNLSVNGYPVYYEKYVLGARQEPSQVNSPQISYLFSHNGVILKVDLESSEINAQSLRDLEIIINSIKFSK